MNLIRKSVSAVSDQKLPNGLFWKIQLLMTAVVAIAAVTTMILTIIFTIGEQIPHARYLQQIVQPAEPLVCPGDDLQFEVEHIAYKTAAIGLTWSWYSLDKDRTVIPNDQVYWVINVGESMGQQVARRSVPELPTGKYELRHASFTHGREEVAVFQVPFIIKPNCP